MIYHVSDKYILVVRFQCPHYGMVCRTFDNLSESPWNYEFKEDIHDWKDVVHWHYGASTDKGIMGYTDKGIMDYSVRETYGSWPALYSITNHIWCVDQFYNPRDDEDTLTTFKLYVNRDSNFKDFKTEIDHIMVGYEITHKTDSGSLIFPIFDHFLSEGGDIVELLYHTDGTWEVAGGFSGRVEIVKGDLETCFKYLIKERYYE